MSFTWFDRLPDWATFPSLAAHLAAGTALGMLYFRSVWWAARRFTRCDRPTTTIALAISRFSLLAALLTLASLEGALPLLAMAFGVRISRSIVMRRVREAAS